MHAVCSNVSLKLGPESDLQCKNLKYFVSFQKQTLPIACKARA